MNELRERKCEVCGGSMGYMSDAAFDDIGNTCDKCPEKEDRGESMSQIVLLLDTQHIYEVYEILYDIPFEKPSMHDSEPPTTRQAGIEQILDQLAERIIDIEGRE